MEHRRGKLRNKFIVAFLVVGVFPLILMSFLVTYLVNLGHRQDISALENQLLAQKNEEISKFVSDIFSLLQIEVGFEQLTEPTPSQQDFLLQSLLFTNKNIIEASLIYAIEPNIKSESPSVKNCREEEIKQANSFGEEICRVSQFQKDESLEFTNQSRLDKFTIPLSGKNYFGPVYYTLNGPMTTLSASVKNKNKQVIAVLSAEVSLAPIQTIVGRAQLGSSGYVFLIDNNANLLAHSQKDFLNKKEFSNLKFLKNIPNEAYLSVFPASPAGGGKKVFGLERIIPKLNWKIFVEWPVDDAQAIVYTLSQQAMIFSLVLLALVLLVSILLTIQIIKPIQTLQSGAKQIGEGKFEQKINIKTRDEIEELGESFNLMAQDLKKLEELRELKIRSEALEESLRKEKELSQIKGAFIATASHQLRTPISVIRWMSELLNSEKPNKTIAEVKSSLSDIYNNSQKLSAIVSDLLLISELGIGYKKTNEEKFDLIQLIEEIIQNYKKIKLDFVKIDKTLEISAQKRVIKQALVNLIDNAVTYTKENGSIKIEVKKDDKNIILSIQDSGIGIPESEKNQIFGQFFRARNSVEMKNVGTGLGLFIAKTIIDGHDGKIWFESEQNKGTTFFVSLPIA